MKKKMTKDPVEPTNYLEQSARNLVEFFRASGLTVIDAGCDIPAGKSKVTFVSQKVAKSNQKSR